MRFVYDLRCFDVLLALSTCSPALFVQLEWSLLSDSDRSTTENLGYSRNVSVAYIAVLMHGDSSTVRRAEGVGREAGLRPNGPPQCPFLGRLPSLQSWNNPGTHDLEAWAHHNLYDAEQAGARALGMDASMWDCSVNHYAGFWWEDLEYYGQASYFRLLGWDADAWDTHDLEPETEDLYWDDLTQVQQAAATQLCYHRDLWDEISLQYWES